MIRLPRSRVKNNSFGGRGRRAHDIGAGFSMARASAGMPSVMRLIQSNWIGMQRNGPADERGKENERDFARVRGEKIMDELLDVVVNAAAFLDRVHDGSEVVVGQNHVGHFFRHIGAGDSHRDANVGHLYCGRVVHAVARHRHDLSARFERRDYAQLVLRRDARVDRQVVDIGRQFFIRKQVQLRAGNDLVFRGRDPNLTCHGERRRGMIAGDHHRANAGRLAFCHRDARFFARRINHSSESGENQIALRVFFGVLIHIPPGQPKNAQCAVGHLATFLPQFFATRGRKRNNFVRPLLEGAALEKKLGSAFGVERGPLSGTLHHDGHQLAFGIEGNFVDDSVIGITPEARFPRDNKKRAFRRIADDLPALVTLVRRLELRIVAPEPDLQHKGESVFDPRLRAPGIRGDKFTFRNVTASSNSIVLRWR